MAEELYQNFGIIYLDRFETKTNFRINDNDNVKAHLESILKLLCLFTVAIFETDSVERKIYYKMDGTIIYSKIHDVIFKLFCRDHLKINENNDIDDNNDSDTSDTSDSNESDSDMEPDDDDYVSGLRKVYPHTPAIKYQLTHAKYEANAITGQGIELLDNDEVYDSELGKYCTAVVIKILGDYEDILCSDLSVNDQKLIKSKIENKYVCFNFDKFSIDVIKISDSEYKCSFSKIKPIHHAASMWARNCLVEYADSDVSKVELVESVHLELTNKDNYFYVMTTYFAINCL